MINLKRVTDEDLVKGKSILVLTRLSNGPLLIDQGTPVPQFGHIQFNREQQVSPATYSCEHAEYLKQHAVPWEQRKLPWSLRAGKLEDELGVERGDNVNWKYVGDFASLCELMGQLPTVLSYPIVEIWYTRPDGYEVEMNVDDLIGGWVQ